MPNAPVHTPGLPPYTQLPATDDEPITKLYPKPLRLPARLKTAETIKLLVAIKESASKKPPRPDPKIAEDVKQYVKKHPELNIDPNTGKIVNGDLDKPYSPPLYIAIGGSSSSGKTKLITALSLIFYDDTLVPEPDEMGHRKKLVDPSRDVIHLDSFFMPEYRGPRGMVPAIGPRDAKILDRPGAPSGLVKSIGLWCYECADSDCLAATNWEKVNKLVYDFDRGLLSSKEIKAYDSEELVKEKTNYNTEMCEKSITKFLNDQGMKVGNFREDQAKLNQDVGFMGCYFPVEKFGCWDKTNVWGRVLFFEGFNLFAQTSNADKKARIRANKKEKDRYLDGSKEGEAEVKRIEWAARMESEGLSMVKNLTDFFDIKIWLPSEKKDVKSRRFNRPAFKDAYPGEAWKTHGYFEHIAWPNHLKYFGHLYKAIEDDTKAYAGKPRPTLKHEGIMIPREHETLRFQKTVKWAVNNILNELAAKEQVLREAFVQMRRKEHMDLFQKDFGPESRKDEEKEKDLRVKLEMRAMMAKIGASEREETAGGSAEWYVVGL